ncbi:M16 family metallopeptidase [Shewanella woodyi]|uniref:Peptidase M16 domain protein n=1 Tax=Shewanella woodyi (strain ATCC 51908 / MS32) TaxID=392500 RepID=B1KE68_SHEWM|nr:pitrilysin family protein [Shewanella woodyi]ACA85054.1 peptidase M16 domain protein [Shewanella woodyi ATCC 51908]
MNNLWRWSLPLNKYLLFGLTALLSNQSHGHELAQMAAPLYSLEQTISYRELDNGLQLRLLPIPSSRSVSIATQFSIGSRDEIVGQTGYAHLFEHMLFKGSENAPGDSYAQTMSALSGQFNASTFFDFTNYYLTLPSEALELALWLEADRFIRPNLTPETVKNQQATVLEEMATTIDNQAYVRDAMEFLLTQAKGTPYGHSVIGSKEDVSKATVKQLTLFHQHHYRPDAAQISIVGGYTQETNSWIDSAFGQWQPLSQPPEKTAADSQAAIKLENRYVHGEIIDDRGPWPALLLAWHTVGQQDKDAEAVTLLEAYLFQNRASLIKQSGLTDPEQLLTYSIPLSMELMGVSNLVVVPRARASLDQLTKNVQQMISNIAKQGIDSASLEQLKANWLNQSLRRLDQPSRLARHLSATQARDKLVPLTGPWERINAVTNEQIQAVANTYFNQGYVRLDLLPPWYIRWTKALLEFLPESVSNSLEESVL